MPSALVPLIKAWLVILLIAICNDVYSYHQFTVVSAMHLLFIDCLLVCFMVAGIANLMIMTIVAIVLALAHASVFVVFSHASHAVVLAHVQSVVLSVFSRRGAAAAP